MEGGGIPGRAAPASASPSVWIAFVRRIVKAKQITPCRMDCKTGRKICFHSWVAKIYKRRSG